MGNEELTVSGENKALSDIANDIASASTLDDELINIFNSELLKKNLVRISKYDEILDDIIEKIQFRLSYSDVPMTNSQLLMYLETIQKLAENASKPNTIDAKNIPKIEYNNQINVVVNNDPISSLDRDSKERVLEAIKSILNDAENEVINNEQ